MHSHSEFVSYNLTDAKLRSVDSSGKVQELELKLAKPFPWLPKVIE